MDSQSTPGTSVIRRHRPIAIMERIATQPYPTTNGRTRAWLKVLDDADLIGHLSTSEESSTAPQETASPALSADRMEEEHDGEQSALAEELSFASYDVSIENIPMQDTWESASSSTMHTASMYDWNGEGESEAMLQSSNAVGQDLSLHGHNEGGHHDGDSVHAPSSRPVSPPPKVSPRKRKRHATRRDVLDEDYDGENIGPASNEGALVGQGALGLYLPSSTAVENNSAPSSPRGSPSPPPPPRRQGILRGKVARRSWKPRVNFGSR